jgi:prevent-host-death family protein
MAMKTVNVHQARTHLSRLLEQAAAGEEVVIARAGKPVARIVPIFPMEPRRLGIAKGRLTDAFFDALPDHELAAWGQ